MNTKGLMLASSLALGAAGFLLTFMPHELLRYLQVNPVELTAVGVQLFGALYLSFSVLNWMAKASLIGGIYSRPVAMGNLLHFLMGAILFFKAAANGTFGTIGWALCLVYSGFALLFGVVLFSHPAVSLHKISSNKSA